MASVDSRLIDTSQIAREGSAIFIRSQQVRDRATRCAVIRGARGNTEQGSRNVYNTVIRREFSPLCSCGSVTADGHG